MSSRLLLRPTTGTNTDKQLQSSKSSNSKDRPPKKKAKVEPEEILYTLWGLSEEFLHRNQIKEAILCLESLFQSKNKENELTKKDNEGQSGISFEDLYPEMQLKSRIRLAEIYLKYTENIDRAKEHLDESLFLVTDLKQESEYKLQILYLLSIIYESKNQTQKLKQTLKRGTEFVTHKTWCEYFTLELIKLILRERESTSKEDALSLISTAIQNAEKSSDIATLILFSLTQCQIYLNYHDLTKAAADLLSIEALLERMGTESTSHSNCISNDKDSEAFRVLHINSPIKSPSAKVIHKLTETKKLLKIHYLILKLIYLIETSNFKEANIKLTLLHDTILSVNGEFDTVFYHWMPTSCLYTCAYILSMICHKPIGNTQTSIAFGLKGLKLIDSILTKEPTLPLGPTTPISIPSTNLSFNTSLIIYKFNILENLIYLHLNTAQLLLAGDYIELAVTLYEQYKSEIPNGLCVIHVVLGLYSTCLRFYDYAIAHLELAIEKSDFADHKIIIQIYLGLVLLNQQQEQPQSQQKQQKQLNTNLEQVSSFIKNHTELATHSNRSIKGGFLLLEGLYNKHTGWFTEARSKLKECLGVTNGSLCHNQIAANALNCLGAIGVEENIRCSGKNENTDTITILKSSLVLSHRSEDFFSKFTALNLLTVLYELKGDHLNTLSTLNYQGREENEWNTAISQATSRPICRKLLTRYIRNLLEDSEIF